MVVPFRAGPLHGAGERQSTWTRVGRSGIGSADRPSHAPLAGPRMRHGRSDARLPEYRLDEGNIQLSLQEERGAARTIASCE